VSKEDKSVNGLSHSQQRRRRARRMRIGICGCQRRLRRTMLNYFRMLVEV
jgi:hypothetical protein